MYKHNPGKKWNRLTLIKRTRKEGKNQLAIFRCDCGNETEIQISSAISGKSRSCGCYDQEVKTTHNMSRTRQYKCWSNIKRRCLNPKCHAYESYGGRGITVCEKWMTFEGFWEDMKEGYSDDLQIDRIDNNDGYYKENCRWATRKEQINNRGSNHFVEFNGERKTIGEWATETGINYETLTSRLHMGWSTEKALTQKIR